MNKVRKQSRFRMEPKLFQRCRSQTAGKKQAKRLEVYQRKLSAELRAPAVETYYSTIPRDLGSLTTGTVT